MSEMPFISIIVPVFNAEKVLRRCVDSIVSQSFPNYEIVLVDDGSTDSSGAICDEYQAADARVRAVHKPNGGVSSARNLGIEHSSGEWVAFVDSDDYVDPDFVEIFAGAINSTDAGIVVQGYHVEGGNDAKYETADMRFGPALSRLKRERMEIVVWNKAFRRSLIKSSKPFDERYSFREDEGFVLDMMSAAGLVHFTDGVAYHYFVPDWRGKYQNEYTQAREFWNIVSRADGVDSPVRALYATQYADAVLNSLGNPGSFTAYSELCHRLKHQRGLLMNRTARLSMLFPPFIGYLLCRFRL